MGCASGTIPASRPIEDEVAESAVLILHVREKPQQTECRRAGRWQVVSVPDATVQDDCAGGIVHARDPLKALLAR
jgi:hypothetical protein